MNIPFAKGHSRLIFIEILNMKQAYRVLVDSDYQFDLGIDDVAELNELQYQDSGSSGSTEKIHILHNLKSFSAEWQHQDFYERSYKIKINGTLYEVNIETALDLLIKEMGLSLGNVSVEDEIHAPMPGIILEVNVSENSEVKKGEYLCVLEAMKMENALTAPRDGIIKSVNIAKGDTVDKGKLLIEFHKND